MLKVANEYKQEALSKYLDNILQQKIWKDRGKKGRVLSVQGWAGWYLDKVVFDLEGNESISIGEAPGSSSKIELKEGETIQKVEVKPHNQYLATGITLTTSTGGTYKIWGSKYDTYEAGMITFTAKPSHEIIGLVYDGDAVVESIQQPSVETK